MRDDDVKAERQQTTNPPHGENNGPEPTDREPGTGRFTAGNAAAVGRKRRARVVGAALLRRELEGVLTPTTARGIVRAALAHLAKGNSAPFHAIMSAIKMVADEELASRIESIEKRLSGVVAGQIGGRNAA